MQHTYIKQHIIYTDASEGSQEPMAAARRRVPCAALSTRPLADSACLMKQCH